jgi:hypothetical protein
MIYTAGEDLYTYFSSKFLHCAALSDTAHTINNSISILTDSWRINFGSLWYMCIALRKQSEQKRGIRVAKQRFF